MKKIEKNFIIDSRNILLFVSQQRFEEMEAKINDLRDEIEIIKVEKNRLEKQIQEESEVNIIIQ